MGHQGPSVEAIAIHVVEEAEAYVLRAFRDRAHHCRIEVSIAETPEDVFSVTRMIRR